MIRSFNISHDYFGGWARARAIAGWPQTDQVYEWLTGENQTEHTMRQIGNAAKGRLFSYASLLQP